MSAKSKTSNGFFESYFSSFGFFFKNFLIFWPIAAIFLIPLGLIDYIIKLNFPIKFNPDFFLQVRTMDIKAATEVSIITLLENKASFLTINIFYTILSFLVCCSLFYALLIAINHIYKKKNIEVFEIIKEFLKNKATYFKTILYIFIYSIFLLFLGGIFMKITSALLINDYNEYLTTYKDITNQEIIEIFFDSAILLLISSLFSIIGFVIFLSRVHITTLAAPHQIEKNFDADQVIPQTQKIAKGKFLKIFGNIFFAGIFTSIIVFFISMIIFSLYLKFTNSDNNNLNQLFNNIQTQSVTFLYTFYPIIIKTFIFPIFTIFIYKLYLKVKQEV